VSKIISLIERRTELNFVTETQKTRGGDKSQKQRKTDRDQVGTMKDGKQKKKKAYKAITLTLG